MTLGLAYRERYADVTQGEPAPADWFTWVRTLFLRYAHAPFAQRHADLWTWAWEIERETAPRPFVAVWPRNGGKTATAELACASLGLRGKRKYALYIRATQQKADESVGNIGVMLEGAAVERFYPEHSARSVGKYGNSRGWRRNRLRTAGGFTVDALGLDTASRGTKLDEQRPDLIILDDIDGLRDSLHVSAEKIGTITKSILPAGATNIAVLAIQNLIIPDGFFTRLVDGRADYLAERIVSGPHKAVTGLETRDEEDPETHARRAIIVGGKATWAGQDLAACQHLIDTIGLSAFEKECQHEVTNRAEGLALRMKAEHVEDLTDVAARALISRATRSNSFSIFAGIDFGAWRFGFLLRVADSNGVVHQIAEYFSQKESLETRAKAIHAIYTHYGVPEGVACWGDAANPTDIMELNLAFERIGSPYRVLTVAMANKIRGASVERLNDLLDRNAFRYRRDVSQAVAAILAAAFKKPVGDFLSWQLGWNASGAGTAMQGSRLQWEVKHWSYPIPKEGEAQEQDPNDDTADGADLIAADRYGTMSWWSFANPVPLTRKPEDVHPGINYATGHRADKGRKVTLSDVMGAQAQHQHQRLSPRSAPMRKVNV